MARAKNIDDARQKLLAQMRRELNNLKHRVQARMVQQHMSGPTGPSSVRARSGHLRQSLDGVVIEQPTRMSLTMYFGGGTPYARIHEYGGTITPKKSANLAIPVGASLTRAGVSRYSGPSAIWGALKFIVNKKTGKKLLIDASLPPGSPVKVMYVLVPSVTLPPRLNFGKTFKAEAESSINYLKQIQLRGTK